MTPTPSDLDTLRYLGLPHANARRETADANRFLRAHTPTVHWCPTADIERVYLKACAHRVLRSGNADHAEPLLEHPDRVVRQLGLEMMHRVRSDPPTRLDGVPLWSAFPMRAVELEDGRSVSRSPVETLALSRSFETGTPSAVRDLSHLTASGDGTAATEWGGTPAPAREFVFVYRSTGSGEGHPPADLVVSARIEIGPEVGPEGGVGLRWESFWETADDARTRMYRMHFHEAQIDEAGIVMVAERGREYDERPDLFTLSDALLHEIVVPLSALALTGARSTASAALVLHPDPVVSNFAVRAHQLWGSLWPVVTHQRCIDYRDSWGTLTGVPEEHQRRLFDASELPAVLRPGQSDGSRRADAS